MMKMHRGAGRRYAIFVVAASAIFMASVDQTIVATALPTLTNSLRVPLSWTDWTITAYALGQVVAMPIAGRVSDSLGRRRLFLIAIVVFMCASAGCGLAPDIYVLITLRLVQALGGGAFMPSALGLVVDYFPESRDKMVGLISSAFPFGALVGPVLGAVIIATWNWRGVFWVNLPLGGILFLAAWFLIPSKETTRRRRVDVAGASLLAGTLALLMLALTLLAAGRPTEPQVWFPGVAGVALGLAFLRHQSRSPSPILPPELLRAPVFALFNGLNFIYGACAIGFAALVPTFAEAQYRLRPIEAGSLLSARGIAMAGAAVMTAFMMQRTGYRPPMVVGYLLLGGGLWLTGMRPIGLNTYAWLSLSSAITGLGLGVSGPSANSAILNLRPEDAAAISGLRGMFRQVGGIFAISLTALATAQSDTGTGLARAFQALSLVVLVVTPLIGWVPGARQAASAAFEGIAE